MVVVVVVVVAAVVVAVVAAVGKGCALAHRDELLRYSSVFAAQLQLLCSFPLLVNEHIPSDVHGWDHTRLVQLQDFIDTGTWLSRFGTRSTDPPWRE